VLDEVPQGDQLSDIYPFTEDQIERVARTEPTLRDMLQQFRHLFDHIVYGPEDALPTPVGTPDIGRSTGFTTPVADHVDQITAADKQHRLSALLGQDEDSLTAENIQFKNVDVIEVRSNPDSEPTDAVLSPAPAEGTGVFAPAQDESIPTQASLPLPGVTVAEAPMLAPAPSPAELVGPDFPTQKSLVLSTQQLTELWEQEFRSARRKLEPDGSLTGATRELQAALGTFLQTCHEHGVKVGPWRLQHVVPEWPFGEHPTYGVVSLAHWACKDGQPWKVGVGLFLARGGGKPKDLEIKLAVMDSQPVVVDHLILLRPEDDMTLSGKSKQLWQDAEKKGKHARLEAVPLDAFALIYSFPRWLSAIRESLPAGAPLPNLADLIQEQAEKLLEQVCMPVQG
jgi:hypothetical protein